MVTNYNTCPKHCHLLDEGTADPHCSPGVCGANLPMHHTIGDEFTWAREGMADELLCIDGLQVSEVSTDPDRQFCWSSCRFLYKDGLLQNKPVHFIDTQNLSETFRKSIKK